jgi:reactive intermediate/imine deaminase
MAAKRKRRAVRSADAPEAIGPYSQALQVGELLFCSGQIPLDPATGELAGGDFRSQARQVLNNLAAVLDAAGMGFADVVRTTVYLTDLADFPVLNELYAEHLSEPYPARVTVGVASLPRGARIEMDLVAIRP